MLTPHFNLAPKWGENVIYRYIHTQYTQKRVKNLLTFVQKFVEISGFTSNRLRN